METCCITDPRSPLVSNNTAASSRFLLLLLASVVFLVFSLAFGISLGRHCQCYLSKGKAPLVPVLIACGLNVRLFRLYLAFLAWLGRILRVIVRII